MDALIGRFDLRLSLCGSTLSASIAVESSNVNDFVLGLCGFVQMDVRGSWSWPVIALTNLDGPGCFMSAP